MICLTKDRIEPAALLEQVQRPHCGAVVCFLGTVRDVTDGLRTSALEYEAYPSMAKRQLAHLEEEARRRWPIGEAAIVHRLGYLEVGEISVAVVLSCPHRAQAFEACQFLIDRVKELVPIWKKDYSPTEASTWIHPGADQTPMSGTRDFGESRAASRPDAP